MKLTIFTLLICFPFLAMGQTDDPINNNEHNYLPPETSLEKSAIWKTTNDLDRKINTTLLQDMPYKQFSLNYNTPKTYNLSPISQQKKKATLLNTQQPNRRLTKLKPINYFHGQFKTSN